MASRLSRKAVAEGGNTSYVYRHDCIADPQEHA